MNVSWLVTPYFFDEYDPALVGAVPDGFGFQENNQGLIADRSPENLARLHQPIAEFVTTQVAQNHLPVSIAGDCCASLPVMAGLQKSGLDPVLVWLDAHADFNTLKTSPSGFLGGMPLAMMVGRGDLKIALQSGLTPVLENDVWLVGARDIDPLEEKTLKASAIKCLSLNGLKNLVFDRPVHLHIDNDIIDASEVPANNYPVAGGPSLTETIQQCVAFATKNNICAISFSGWNGKLDQNGKTRKACTELLYATAEASRL